MELVKIAGAFIVGAAVGYGAKCVVDYVSSARAAKAATEQETPKEETTK